MHNMPGGDGDSKEAALWPSISCALLEIMVGKATNMSNMQGSSCCSWKWTICCWWRWKGTSITASTISATRRFSSPPIVMHFVENLAVKRRKERKAFSAYWRFNAGMQLRCRVNAMMQRLVLQSYFKMWSKYKFLDQILNIQALENQITVCEEPNWKVVQSM